MTDRSAVAIAHPNIALAKYWGKRDDGENLPAVPSLSVTLSGMATTTRVSFDSALAADELVLAGEVTHGRALDRVSGLLDRVRAFARFETKARVESANDFPTASGLASSASAFAALAVAARAAAGLGNEPIRASDLARRTSVSAARSVFGGFVALPIGDPNRSSLAADPIAPAEHWSDLRVVVAVTHEGPKAIGSTAGMLHTVRTSAYYAAWVSTAPRLFERVRSGVLARDLEALGPAVEESALLMHASAIAASPGILYWNGATVEALAEVRRLRTRGVAAYATIDAGPHVKVLTTAADESAVVSAMASVPGVLRTIRTEPGQGARISLHFEPRA